MAVADAAATADIASRETRDEWLDRNSGRIMVLPAVIILLAFAIFPLIISIYLSLCRFALAGGSFTLTFIGLFNYKRLLFGAQQYHFLGTMKPLETPQWIAFAVYAAVILYWLGRYAATSFSVLGMIGRLVSASLATGIVLATLATIPAGGYQGTLMTTCFYVLVGVLAQFLIGLGLALLCAQPIRLPQLLSSRLLHSPDGDASRRRVHVPHAGRHAEGALRPAERGVWTHRVVLGDAGLVGASDGPHRRHLAVDAVHVHRPARRHRKPAARPARGGAPRWRKRLAGFPRHHLAVDCADRGDSRADHGSSKRSRSSTFRTF